ncbi:hypothetical protein FVEN_g8723 [Fusarium venenatum]|nr:hypothetical protein FVEN_g8723 [Fusarium venenatum]
MASFETNVSVSGSPSGPADFDDNSSVTGDLSTIDFNDDFHNDLLEIIQNIKPPGKFAFGAGIKLPSDFSISVNEVGNVALPLVESQARQIITKARQAPFGKGTDIFVDTSVRDRWELDPS